MDQVTQQNAALVEEAAAAGESLKQQAMRLAEASRCSSSGAARPRPTRRFRLRRAAGPGGRMNATTRFHSLDLSSRFQPIYGVAERRAIGYEALLTAVDMQGVSIAPDALFEQAQARGESVYVDWMARALHLRNFDAIEPDAEARLFMNVSPRTAIEDARFPSVFAAVMETFEVDPKRVVVEILEDPADEEARLADAVAYYRGFGCAIALDDFANGVICGERMARLQPEVVKVARSARARTHRSTRAVGACSTRRSPRSTPSARSRCWRAWRRAPRHRSRSTRARRACRGTTSGCPARGARTRRSRRSASPTSRSTRGESRAELLGQCRGQLVLSVRLPEQSRGARGAARGPRILPRHARSR